MPINEMVNEVSLPEIPIIPLVKCYNCGDEIKENQEYDLEGDLWCQDCYDENSARCNHCDCAYHMENIEYCNLCENYYCNRDRCVDVHDQAHNENQEENHTIAFRNVKLDCKKYQAHVGGEIIESPRKFGVELELLYENSEEMSEFSNVLDQAYGIARDGSISGDGNGIEIQTPIFSGFKGENEMKKLLASLNAMNTYVNATCGFHVHLDGEKIAKHFQKIKNVWMFYHVFDEVFLAMLPRSRRANNYCHSLNGEYRLKEIENCFDIDSLEALWYRTTHRGEIDERKNDNKDNSRYRGINLHTLLTEGHIEIRYHSGTLNAEKILNWIAIHQKILDLIEADGINMEEVKEIISDVVLSDKLVKFFAILQLPENIKKYVQKRIVKFSGKNALTDENQLICAE